MHFLKAHFWKLTLLGGAVAVASWLGWGYADQRRTTLVAVNTTTGKLQWVYPLTDDFSYSKGPIAGNGKVVLDGCLRTTDKNCGAYQIQTFNAQSGQLLWSNRPSGSYQTFDGQSGKQLWRNRPGGNYIPYEIASNQAIVIQNDRLYLQLEHELQALDPATGVQRWQTPRRWFFGRGVWYGMGIVDRPNKLAILNPYSSKASLQTLDPKTGKLLQGTAIKIPKLKTTRNIIAANDRTLFLETSVENPYGSVNNTSTVMAYDSKILQTRFRTDIKSDGIFQMNAIPQSGGFYAGRRYANANENTLLLGTYDNYDVETQKSGGNGWLAMDADTGRVLWQKKDSQLNCRLQRSDYQVDIDTVYLPCRRYDDIDEVTDTRIVALSIQTGAVKWQTQLSNRGYYRDLPATVTDRQYLTFRRVKANTWQTQAVALDRQTGKLLWAVPLFDDEAGYVNTFRSIVAAQGDRFFTLDRLPRWQLWLLHINPNWYLKQPISN
jgi:outer membrane protein assembly factor BamB